MALLDADFGMANSHILLNHKVTNTIQDILENKAAIEQVVHDTSSGLKLIPGGSGILELLNLDSKKRWEIIRSLDPLKDTLDYLVVDTPAGASDAEISAFIELDHKCMFFSGIETETDGLFFAQVDKVKSHLIQTIENEEDL